ncbi:MAG TPA: 3'(2'),5'-bisphosphate nucleotidase CysQ [Steroidobacteraceae bacterium]|nr:3'(2'),5'-bisphosphate nucleotidase CysQ [Steroidobacteraceae bacterium]
MTYDLHHLLLDVVALSREAGRAILGVYSSSFTVREKDDASPLTEADLRSQEILASGLRRLRPELPILSEEAEAIPFATRSRWDWLWIIDPLDGTKEFVQRNGEFTVNVALVHGNRPVLGVVHAPVLDTDYFACEGYGAFRRRGQEPAQPIRVTEPAAAPVRVVGSRSHRGSSLDGFLERVGPHQLVAVGSSLKFCMVAEGAADVYPRLGPTSEWDTAAGHCVLEQAGGHVVRLDGQPLSYNARPEILNPHFLAYGDDGPDWAAMLR